MIVIDASALLEFLLQTPLGARVEARLLRDEDEFHSPHLIDVEVAQGLRRLVRTGEAARTRTRSLRNSKCRQGKAAFSITRTLVILNQGNCRMRCAPRCRGPSSTFRGSRPVFSLEQWASYAFPKLE